MVAWLQILQDALVALNALEARLDRITLKLEHGMATAKDFKDLVDLLNTETDAIASRIDAILAKLQTGGMTEAEEAVTLTDLQAISDRLKSLGTDPTDPIPG